MAVMSSYSAASALSDEPIVESGTSPENSILSYQTLGCLARPFASNSLSKLLTTKSEGNAGRPTSMLN